MGGGVNLFFVNDKWSDVLRYVIVIMEPHLFIYLSTPYFVCINLLEYLSRRELRRILVQVYT